MSGGWHSRIHSMRPPLPLRDMQDAARTLDEQAGRTGGHRRLVFQTVADVALLGTVFLTGALAAVHLWKALFPKHKENQGRCETAGGRR